MNANGVIVGYSHPAGLNVTHPFRWTQGDGMQDLGSVLGGDSFANLINESGQIAGNSCSPDRSVCHALYWSSSTGIVDVGTLGGSHSGAAGLNDLGQIVGTSDLPSGLHHAFLWTVSGGMQDLGTLSGDSESEASSLNNSAQVVGTSKLGGTWHPFLWSAADGMLDLGDLGAHFGYATFIDDSGHVAGSSALVLAGRTTAHTFQWISATGMVDIGTPGNKPGDSTPSFLYNNGRITANFKISRLFVWSPPSSIKSVPLISYFGFNQAGQIAGEIKHVATLITPLIQVTLKSSKKTVHLGTAVKFTAKVSCVAGPAPDGEQVQFKDGAALLGTGLTAGGMATFTTSSLPVGTHAITAAYVGDEIYDSRTSKVLSLVDP
jgi:probable HAF family extracellular repeat protein